MKKILLTLSIIFIFTETDFSWDTTIAKYLPLQVGNVWVYTGITSGYIYYGSYYEMYKITGTVDTLGHRYYYFQRRLVQITGSSNCAIWHLANYFVRIDSASMNVYKLAPICNNYETLLDSLKARLNDTAYICSGNPGYNYSKCLDTSSYYFFGNNVSAKKFGAFLGPGIMSVYAKDIGIIIYSYGYQMNQCHDTLKGCVINGVLKGDTNMIVGINQISSEIPDKFSLSQNYPNPFNPTTKIRFDIPSLTRMCTGVVVLKVYDALSREIQTLVNEQLQPGTYEVNFDGSNFSSGVYYYSLQTETFTETKRMVLIK